MSDTNNVLLAVKDMKKHFPIKKEKIFQRERYYVKANDGITLDIYEGETLGLVGESGCGKSTFGRVLLQLDTQSAGRTKYYGRTIEEFHPGYIERDIKHVKSNLSAYKELEEKRRKLEGELEKSPEDFLIMQELQEVSKEADQYLYDMTDIFGGFIVVDNLEEVSQLLLSEHSTKHKIYTLQNPKKGKAAPDSEAQIAELQKSLAEIESKLEAERAKHAGEEKFDEYEALRDNGINLAKLTYAEMRLLRKDLQIVFQDPYSSLNPRMTVGQIIGEGLLAHGFFEKNNEEMQDYVMQVMEDCGLSGYMIHRYPHQFSGGQRQRIGIARALALQPKFVVCDEAVSALDVSIQSQVINLLSELKKKEDLTYLFITHDLSVVKYISDRIGVMYLGNIVELCDSEDIFENPLHPYTDALIGAIPTTDLDRRELTLIEGDIPSPINPPKGCKFHTRCTKCMDICKEVVPAWKEERPNHFVACHLYD